MFKKTIEYTDFNGDKQSKDFWFHLSNAKLAVLASDGGLKRWSEQMMKEQNPTEILDKIRYLVKLACGVRSEDGQRFTQTEEAQSELLDSPAFDELLFELFVGQNASTFFSALVPPEQQKQIEELAKKQGVVDPFKEPEDPRPKYQIENREPYQNELQAMSRSELQSLFVWKGLKEKGE
jgi:hypothetical protein